MDVNEGTQYNTQYKKEGYYISLNHQASYIVLMQIQDLYILNSFFLMILEIVAQYNLTSPVRDDIEFIMLH